jgi:integrase
MPSAKTHLLLHSHLLIPKIKNQPTDTMKFFCIKFARALTNDQSFLTIRLYDLRHAYATKQLRRTQNAEKVRIIMGHKRLNTTQKYLHLLNFDTGEWECEYAQNKEEAKKLIEANFQYVATTPDKTMLFKKPK